MSSFPFIVGCGRSGTTLLRAMFDSHPDLAVTHELQFIGRMAQRRRSFEARGHFDEAQFLKNVVQADSFRHLQMTEEEARSAVTEAQPADFAAAVRALMTCYATRRGKGRYADKTPGNVTRIAVLSSVFPEARFIHIVRDGRDSMLSYHDRGFGPQALEEAALNWRTRVRRGRGAGSALGPARYTEVRYEDLVDDPEAALRPLCAFLDLEFDPAMLLFHERSHDLLVGVPSAHAPVFDNLSRPVTKGLRDWRSTLSRDQTVAFAALAGDVLVDLGYDLGVDTVPIAKRGAAMGYRLSRNVRRTWRWTRVGARRLARAPRA